MDFHGWIDQRLFYLFGPLDQHRRHVLLTWTVGIFLILTVIEIVTEWWKRRR